MTGLIKSLQERQCESILTDLKKGEVLNSKPRKPRPKLENTKKVEKKKTKRETLQVSRATIDLTSDAMTDASSDGESIEGLSPVRRVYKLLHSAANPKPRRKKKMPPELKIIPAAKTSDSPVQSDREKKMLRSRRPRSVSMFNEPPERPRLNPASWHQFRKLPPPKCLSDMKNRNTQPSELQVKLNVLKKNVWTGIQNEEKGPLSWGLSSFAMNSYFTDSEALLRSCSKKLEELEGERKKNKDEKKRKKTKSKKQIFLKVPYANESLEPINKLPKSWKKKGKLKHAKSDSTPYVTSASFTEVPRNTGPQKASPTESRQKSRFRKGAIVTTAIQTKKSSKVIISDNSDSEDSIQMNKKIKKKSKSSKAKFSKAMSENKSKN